MPKKKGWTNYFHLTVLVAFESFCIYCVKWKWTLVVFESKQQSLLPHFWQGHRGKTNYQEPIKQHSNINFSIDSIEKLTCTTRSDSWADAHKGNWFWARIVIMAPQESLNFSIFWPEIPIKQPAWVPAIKSLMVLAATCPAATFASVLLSSSCFKENCFFFHQCHHGIRNTLSVFS